MPILFKPWKEIQQHFLKKTVLFICFLFLLHCSGGTQFQNRMIDSPGSDLLYPDKKLNFRQEFSPPGAQILEIIAGGDVMIGHWTQSYLQKYGSDYPFREIEHLLSGNDIVFANLEAPFADSGEITIEKQFTFKVPTKHVRGLKQAGFNVMSLANNHILDYGFNGLQQTLQALDSAKIQHAGAGFSIAEAWEPALLKTPAGRVAILAFSMTFPKEFWATDSTGGTAYPYEDKLRDALNRLQNSADFTIVSFHWGKEKSSVPKQYQQYFARLAIDHGADLVIGHHPHVLQGFELYHGKLIAYSLGNLAFSAYSRSAVNSALLRIVLSGDGNHLYSQIIPLNVDNIEVEFQPKIAAELRKNQIITHLDTLSRELTGRDIISENGLIFDFLQSETLTAETKNY